LNPFFSALPSVAAAYDAPRAEVEAQLSDGFHVGLLSDLHSVAGSRQGTGCWTGLRRTAALMQYARACRGEHVERRKSERVKKRYMKLRGAWNSMRLRAGDCAQDVDGTRGHSMRANQFTTIGVLRTAYRCIGKGSVDREGIDGTTGSMNIACGVASASCIAQAQVVAKTFDEVVSSDSSGSLVVTRHYDPTPWKVSFGRLQEALYPHARYLIKENNRFRLVPLDRFRQTCPRARLSFGVLEVMAQRASVHWATRLSDDVPLVHNHEIICPPVVLQRANASCIHSAVEQAVAELSIPGIKQYLEKKRFCLLHDCPDNASAMKRRQAKLIKELSGTPGAFVNTMGCCAHKVHRVAVTSTEEEKFLGDIHAVAFSASLPGHCNTLQQALLAWVDTVEISHVPPDPAWEVQKRAIISHTLKRREDRVRGALLDGEAFKDAHDDREDSFEALLRYVNGDTREPTLVHHEVGCCGSLAETKANMYAAILNSGLLLGRDTDLPRKDKWGSATRALGMACAGQMFHGVLRKVVTLAFPSWDSGLPPANPADGDQDDDYRAMCRSKTWRMGKVLRDCNKEVQWAIVSWTAEPLDHLWQRLQFLDVRGNVLVACSGPSSPFKECSRAFMAAVVTPISAGILAALFWHYHTDQSLARRVRSHLMCMAAQTR